MRADFLETEPDRATLRILRSITDGDRVLPRQERRLIHALGSRIPSEKLGLTTLLAGPDIVLPAHRASVPSELMIGVAGEMVEAESLISLGEFLRGEFLLKEVVIATDMSRAPAGIDEFPAAGGAASGGVREADGVPGVAGVVRG